MKGLAAAMGLFLSTITNKIDKKGRVSVPASFRAVLGRKSGAGFVIFPSFRHAALEGCGLDRMESLSSRVEGLDLFSENQDDLASLLFASAEELTPDPEGRITLSERLLAHAGIKETVSFVGKGATFQVWNPEAFQAHQAAALQRAKKAGLTLPGGVSL